MIRIWIDWKFIPEFDGVHLYENAFLKMTKISKPNFYCFISTQGKIIFLFIYLWNQKSEVTDEQPAGQPSRFVGLDKVIEPEKFNHFQSI